MNVSRAYLSLTWRAHCFKTAGMLQLERKIGTKKIMKIYIKSHQGPRFELDLLSVCIDNMCMLTINLTLIIYKYSSMWKT